MEKMHLESLLTANCM